MTPNAIAVAVEHLAEVLLLVLDEGPPSGACLAIVPPPGGAFFPCPRGPPTHGSSFQSDFPKPITHMPTQVLVRLTVAHTALQ
jgi:hypothetical protein